MGETKRDNGSNGESVSYENLLDRVHKDGLKEVRTGLIQRPDKENQFTAIVFARVKTNKGIFSGIGDASPSNVTPEYAPHYIRVAETRAKARAYRDAVNVASVGIDELGPGRHNGKGNVTPANTTQDKQASTSTTAASSGSQASPSNRPDRTESPMSERQRSYLFRLLAQRGFEGDVAHEELKRLLAVKSLKEATKQRARDLIDKFVKSAEA